MNWLSKIGAEVNRLFGTSLSEDVEASTLVETLQNLNPPASAEAVTEAQTATNEAIANLTTRLEEVTETITAFETRLANMESLEETIRTETTEAITTLKTEVGTTVSELKLQKPGEKKTTTAVVPPNEKKSDVVEVKTSLQELENQTLVRF